MVDLICQQEYSKKCMNFQDILGGVGCGTINNCMDFGGFEIPCRGRQCCACYCALGCTNS